MSAATVNTTHGGDLDQAAHEFGIPRQHWLDLSTGIAPWSWPVPDIPNAVWQRLPAVECPLKQPAARYYGCAPSAVMAIPGSQFAIQTLPQLFAPKRRVALPVLGYFEHRKAWQQAGHQLVDYADHQLDQLEAKILANQLDVVLVINPNNPTTTVLDKQRLLRWRDQLARNGGLLIVDEAFMDSDDAMSLAPECPGPGLIVLRSLGKFFGLAGLRLGFMLAEPAFQEKLAERLGPWAVNGPAQYLGAKALADRAWQQVQQQRIRQMMTAQLALLNSLVAGLAAPHDDVARSSSAAGSAAEPAPHYTAHYALQKGPLFCSAILPQATASSLYQQLGKAGILVRRFAFADQQWACLRFGLTQNTQQLARLGHALSAFQHADEPNPISQLVKHDFAR